MHERHLRLTFNISSISGMEVTSLAEILLHSGDTQRSIKTRQRLHVSVLSSLTSKIIHSFTHRVVVQRTQSNGLTEALDVSRVIQNVIAAGFTNSLLRISLKLRVAATKQIATTLADNMVLVLYTEDRAFFNKLQEPSHEENHQEEPDNEVMVVRGQPNRHHSNTRTRRTATQSRKPKCQKEDLIVDFDQIGWSEWVVYPKTYNAYQCSGKCRDPVTPEYDPTNHSIMQSLMRLTNRSTTGRLCCVPTSLQPLSMLYYEQGEIVVRHHQAMVVEACGCR